MSSRGLLPAHAALDGVLDEHPAIAQAAVMGLDDESLTRPGRLA